jgi:hypothetical protein
LHWLMATSFSIRTLLSVPRKISSPVFIATMLVARAADEKRESAVNVDKNEIRRETFMKLLL